VVFLLINTAIEALIVRRLHRKLIEKRNRMEHMNSSTGRNGSLSMRAKRKLEMDGKREHRAITMAVANSLINYLFFSGKLTALYPRVLYSNSCSRCPIQVTASSI
jgi:hypothetical protein